MKKSSCILSAIIILFYFTSCSTKVEEEKAPAQYSIEQFYKNINYGGGSFSADESKLLINSNATGIYNLYALKVDGSGMDTITRSTDESIFALSYFPDDDRILYAADKGGNEISHIYLLNEDGSVVDLTPGENEKAEFAGWSRDGKSFFYVSNKRNPQFFDLYEMKIAAFEPEMVYENKDGYSLTGFSDNKRYIVLSKSISSSINELYVYDVQKKLLTQISTPGSNSSSNSQEISKDNRYLYFTTDEGEEFRYLNRYDLETGKKDKVLKTDWDIWYAYHSWNDKYRIVGINEDAKTAIQLTDMKSNKPVSIPKITGGDITAVNVSKSENLMRLSVGSSRAPSDIYLYNFSTKELKKLTNSLNPEINAEDLVEGEVIRYKSFDGVEIPAILYKPKLARKDNKAPVMVWVHGGPGGQTRLNYFPLLQYLVNNGYGIIGVNNRGSSGYGKTFFRMDDKRHGEDDLMDCVKAKDYLATLDWVDTSKIGIIGGSYGGYMVMAALAFQPEAFDVGVNIFGVTNWIRTLRSIPSWWESQRNALYEELGDPYSEDSVRLHKISPLFHAQNVSKPLMVLQGANDPRVLQVESDEIVAAVQKNGVPVEYVLFPDEGHGFRKKENEIKGYGEILTFLNNYLKVENEFEKLNQ